MKVLFVTSGNSKFHKLVPAFIKTQAESLRSVGVHVEFYQIKGKGAKGYFSHITPLRKHLKTNKYDIIHAHYGFCGVVSALARYNEILVVSFMGESEFKPDPEDPFNLIIRIMMILHRLFARLFFDYIIFKSENLAQFIPSVKHKASIIPNGVNFKMFYPMDKLTARSKLKLPINKKIVLWVGNQTRVVKGFDLAKSAIEIVKEQINDVYFLAVNDIPNKELVYYYNAADVFLLSSLSEGSPNVVKEAMACNCPIVSTPVGDVKMITLNTLGCYVSLGFSPKEMSLLLIKVLSEVKRSNGLLRLNELQLDTNSIAIKLTALYEKLLNK